MKKLFNSIFLVATFLFVSSELLNAQVLVPVATKGVNGNSSVTDYSPFNNTVLLHAVEGITGDPQMRFVNASSPTPFFDLGMDGNQNFTIEFNDSPKLGVLQSGDVGIGANLFLNAYGNFEANIVGVDGIYGVNDIRFFPTATSPATMTISPLGEIKIEAETVGTGNLYDAGLFVETTYPAGSNVDLNGISGVNLVDAADGYGIGVRGGGGYVGVAALSSPNAAPGGFFYAGTQSVGGGTSGGAHAGIFATASGGVNNYAGYFSGDIDVTGTIFNTSDAKFKTGIKKASGSTLTKINQLQPKQYEFKSEYVKSMHLSTGLQNGFIAQELQAVFPELVAEQVMVSNDDFKTIEGTYLGVNYTGMIPILTKGIQELSAENASLKDQNEALESRLAKLEAQMEALLND